MNIMLIVIRSINSKKELTKMEKKKGPMQRRKVC